MSSGQLAGIRSIRVLNHVLPGASRNITTDGRIENDKVLDDIVGGHTPGFALPLQATAHDSRDRHTFGDAKAVPVRQVLPAFHRTIGNPD